MFTLTESPDPYPLLVFWNLCFLGGFLVPFSAFNRCIKCKIPVSTNHSRGSLNSKYLETALACDAGSLEVGRCRTQRWTWEIHCVQVLKGSYTSPLVLTQDISWLTKQECFPLGCIPPALPLYGGLPGQRPPDRNPLDKSPPPPPDRDPL